MPHDRFFSSIPLKTGENALLSKEEERHLKVMRKKPHDLIELIDGNGNLATATLSIDGSIKIGTVINSKKPVPQVILMAAIPHPNHLDWMIEKVTELGIDSVHFFPGKLSDFKTLKENQIERLKRIMISATKQSGRLFLPTIELKPSLSKWQKPQGLGFYGSMLETDPYLVDMLSIATPSLFYFVGPERGFDATEIQTLKGWNIQGTRLNINTLRTETASVAAASLLLTKQR